MPDRIDNTTGFLDDGWVPPPTPGTPSYRHVEADLRAQSEAEVHQAPDGTGLVALAWAQGRIEGRRR